MSEALDQALAADIVTSFSGEKLTEKQSAKVVEIRPGAMQDHEHDPVLEQFSFDEAFQERVIWYIWRDPTFNEQTFGLIRPEYFSTIKLQTIAKIGLDYFNKFRGVPTHFALGQIIADAKARNIVRAEVKEEVGKLLLQIMLHEAESFVPTDRDYLVEKVTEFARTQAITSAILKSADLLQKVNEEDRFDRIDKLYQKAREVGSIKVSAYDYFDEIVSRTKQRELELLGSHGAGITTGVKYLDDKLFHKGWGRSELSVIMGGAKSGKSTWLLESAIKGAINGYRVLYITLEMSLRIAAMRLDANFTNTPVRDVRDNPKAVHEAVSSILTGGTVSGKLFMNEFPSGTFAPKDLSRLINWYSANGTTFDLVVVDYLDIMRPNTLMNNDIANSKSVWVDSRAIAQQHDFALLTATQTNREGYTADVAKAEHAAEDFNKIRIADLVISINKTEEEARDGIARLFFAAARNQEGLFTITVKQDIERMRFIAGLVSAH